MKMHGFRLTLYSCAALSLLRVVRIANGAVRFLSFRRDTVATTRAKNEWAVESFQKSELCFALLFNRITFHLKSWILPLFAFASKFFPHCVCVCARPPIQCTTIQNCVQQSEQQRRWKWWLWQSYCDNYSLYLLHKRNANVVSRLFSNGTISTRKCVSIFVICLWIINKSAQNPHNRIEQWHKLQRAD